MSVLGREIGNLLGSPWVGDESKVKVLHHVHGRYAHKRGGVFAGWESVIGGHH